MLAHQQERYTTRNLLDAVVIAALVASGLRVLVVPSDGSQAVGGLSFTVLLVGFLCLCSECLFEQAVVRCGIVFGWGLLTLWFLSWLALGDLARLAVALCGMALTCGLT